MTTDENKTPHEGTAPDALDFLAKQTAEGASATFATGPAKPTSSSVELLSGDALGVLSQLGQDGARPAGVEPVARPVAGHAVDVIAGLQAMPIPAGAPGRDIEAWARTASAPREED
jgi:hypothetical protein